MSTGPTGGCDPPPTPAARLVHGCHLLSALRTVSHGVPCVSVASTTSSPAGVVVHAAVITGPMSGFPSPAIVPRTSPHADHGPLPAAYLIACHSRPAGSTARVLRSVAKAATAVLVTGRMSGCPSPAMKSHTSAHPLHAPFPPGCMRCQSVPTSSTLVV